MGASKSETSPHTGLLLSPHHWVLSALQRTGSNPLFPPAVRHVSKLHQKKSGHVQPAEHGCPTTWPLSSNLALGALSTSIEAAKHCSKILQFLPGGNEGDGLPPLTLSSHLWTLWCLNILSAWLDQSYFRHATDTSKHRQWEGEIYIRGIVDWIAPWNSVALAAALLE